ncbi:MAG: GFA family protein [Pseudomonadota bacterium]
MIRGCCLCKHVIYEYSGSIEEVVICHCDQCKQAQGTPFATNAPIDTTMFKFLKGEEMLTTYFSSPNKKRVFCASCGSPIYSQRTDLPEKIRLRLGTVTEGDIPTPNYQIYCTSKSNWFELDDEKPKYDNNRG